MFAPSLLAVALVAVGGAYAAISNAQSAQADDTGQVAIDAGNKLYLTGCSSCHGMQAQGSQNGPTLLGVGAASVHFQVATGRMPLAAPGAQAVAKEPQYSAEETAQLSAYVASLAPGPAIPTAEQLDYKNADIAQTFSRRR